MACRRLVDEPAWRRSEGLESGQTLVVRLATHTDYEAVVDIDKDHTVYGGHDYIPHLYHTIIQEPHTYPFVGVLDGTIVYFTVMHVVEGGTATVSCAARVSEACKGQKIALTARQHVVDIIQRNIITVKRDCWTGVMWDNVQAAAKKPIPPFKIIQKWDFKAVMFSAEELRTFLSGKRQRRDPPYNMRLLNKPQSWGILSDVDICRKIFPAQKTIFIGQSWMPYNIPATREDFNHIYTTCECYGIYDKSGVLVGFGTHHAFPSVVATECSVWYYGSGVPEAINIFLTNILREKERHTSGGKRISLALSCQEYFDPKIIYDFFGDSPCDEDKKAAYMCSA